MSNNRDFKKEYDIFQQKIPYQTTVVDGIEVRYQYGGNEDAPVLSFLTDWRCRKCGCHMLKNLERDTDF